jgi:uncharacterized MAPEG superfamily protein
MPIALWCVLVAAVLPALSVFPAKLGGDYDNARPRDPEFWRDGFRARAFGAMANGFEAFPLFAVAVVVATSRGGAGAVVDTLSVIWVVARILYVACYWADRPTLRSAVWAVSFLVAVAIFLTPIWASAPPA